VNTTQLLEVLVSFSLQVLAITTTGMILERTMRRSADRCAIWSMCFCSILFLAAAGLLLPRLHFFQPWSSLTPHELLTVTAVQTLIGKDLLALWGLGATVHLLRWMVRSYMLRRSLCNCVPLPKSEVESLLATIDTPISDDQLPTILITDDSEGPYCWQLHRPAIVLPRFLMEGSREDLRNVLVHELEHLRTNHPLQLFMQQLAQVVCWFHPAVWKASWRASLAREFYCDDAAAGDGANCTAYLRTLLHIAEHCEQRQNTSTFSFGRNPSEIVIRANRLVKLARDRMGGSGGRFLTRRMAACLLLLVTITMSQFWIPSDPLASSRAVYSPWPTWTAQVLHCFGYVLRDYEQFDRRAQPYELRQMQDGNWTSARLLFMRVYAGSPSNLHQTTNT
jgi:beta-lactamase regulating signal transducer with metallopeptidase domain